MTRPGPGGYRHAWLVATALVVLVGTANAAEAPTAADESQANNPLANVTAFNLHNYYIGEFTETDQSGNSFWLRFAKPFSVGSTRWLTRTSLPINTYPVPPSMDTRTTGLGDLNVFAAYLFDTAPGLSASVGPQLTAPTASEDALGTGKYSAGLVHVLFDARSKVFQYGYLLSWQASFAGDEDRDEVNIGSAQPFLFYQLGGGTYLRSTAVMSYNFEASTYTVPIGFGIGQVIPSKDYVFNVFVEPQVSVADDGPGWPSWQIFVGFNTQLK